MATPADQLPFPPEGMPPEAPMNGDQYPPPRGNEGDEVMQALTESAPRPDPHAEVVNLAAHLNERELTEIAEEVISEYEADEESRSEWLEMHAAWVRLYFLRDRPKNPPWPGSSSESLPILVEGCNQFHARAYKAFFSSPKFISAAPIGRISAADQDRADRVGRYMSWQLSIEDRSYKRNKDRLLKSLPLHGSYFTKVYRDPIKNRNVIENVRPLDMVIPYGAAGIDIEDLERKTQIISLPLRKGKYLHKTGWFVAEPEAYMRMDIRPIQAAVDEATGIRDSGLTDSSKNDARILEQHRYLDLDEDGISEPYIVWVDVSSRKVLRVTARYDMNELGEPLSNKDPIEYFTHYAYLENPDGFLGLGLGHMTGSMNSAANKILRQCIDAGTLQNIRTGFVSKAVSLPKGRLEMEYGKIVAVEGMVEDLRKALMFVDYPGPSQALIGLMQTIVERADRLNMVTDLLTGQPHAVMQPTTVLAEIEQALMTFSAVESRVYSSLESELAKLFRLNGMYTRDIEYFAINDGMGMQQGQVSREDFAHDLQIMPVYNLRDATESARMARADKTMQFAMANPLIQSSPPHIYEASKRYLEAIGETDIELLLPDPQVLAQKEQEGMAMQQQQGQQQAEAQQAAMAQKTTADALDDKIELERLDIKREELEIKRMQAQADVVHKQAALEATAEQADAKHRAEMHRAAAQIDQNDAKIDIEKLKTAGQYETAMRKLKVEVEGGAD